MDRQLEEQAVILLCNIWSEQQGMKTYCKREDNDCHMFSMTRYQNFEGQQIWICWLLVEFNVASCFCNMVMVEMFVGLAI